MRRGDFPAAWRVSDATIAARAPDERCWHLPRHEQWVWDGRPPHGRRVLVRCYHGLGDTIQFARFLPWLDGIARETIVWAQPALLGLLALVSGRRRLLPLHDGDPGVEYEADVEIMELGHVLRVTLETLPTHVPYFDVPRGPRLASSGLAVGVAAEAGDWDPRRSVPADLLLGVLGGLGGIACYNLQLSRPLRGLADLSTPDLLLLARRLRSLDLVIAPDTMLAHLAGALAVPTWTLLHAEADWRWMQADRRDSPWYPTMRLIRQPRAGDWQSVIDELQRLLSEFG